MTFEKRGWVTLLTRPSYLAGVVILAYSLRKHESQIPLIVLVTDGVPQECIDILKAEGSQVLMTVKRVEHLTPRQKVNIVAKRFADTWTTFLHLIFRIRIF